MVLPAEAGARWLARGEDALPAGVGWLAPGETQRAASVLRYTKRRTEYLLAPARREARGRRADRALAGRPARCWRPSRCVTRPAVRRTCVVDGAPIGLTVSITDRAGWAVCLVGPGADGIGCDLELVEPRTDGFVRDFFTAAERRYVAARPAGEERDVAANLIWSAKESALKVLRTGLRRDTRSVEVSVDGRGADGWGGLSVRASEGDRFPGWWRRDGRFLFTVAAA